MDVFCDGNARAGRVPVCLSTERSFARRYGWHSRLCASVDWRSGCRRPDHAADRGLLTSAINIKHRAILSLAYATTGLRASEVVSLKLTDIDRDRMLIR